MRLLYITNGITGVGGLERVLSVKASYFADKLGYDVCIVSLNEAGKEPFYTFSPKIIFHSVDVSKNKPEYFAGIRRIVNAFKPDVISVCDDGLKGFFVPLWIGTKAKIIYERHVSKEMVTHGRKPNLKQQLSFLLMNIGSRFYDKFIVLTSDNKQQWKSENVEIIPNPLPFYPESVSKLENKTIIAVGKVSIQKGYDRLQEAWELIRHTYPDWSIDIYGTMPPDNNLPLIDENTSIHIKKPVKDIQKEYLSSSVYALPSRYEGFGMVLIEAMACGVPCIAFDCPCGPRDIITDGIDGFLVENGNIQQFAQRLSVLIEDEKLRKTMGENARRNVKRYNVDIIGRQWDSLFRSL
ncbi:glycosyltransferase family 4 protein [Dysgonomonas sp. 25]|uniref:glycosyltransferase family 4 protein n=1 Tax=Dysgonomonas sp. 25 TaxID=2302933 RepID=UPI0013D142CD|nr:glycosyltransferase family 4 protein [Dysgonomonas sp. 25]NDV67961.1 glycosyltransferase family 4 protein [Dysgonomonas sp. 25]